MNHAFAISQRRIQRIEQARTPRNKRTTTLLRLAALLGRASINDGQRPASLADVPLHASACPSPIQQCGTSAGHE